MAQSKDLRERVDQIIERAEKELLHASRQLVDGIDRGTTRVVPPVSIDLEHIVDDVFDFAERVIKGQRRMVKEIVTAFNEPADRAHVAGRKATKRAATHQRARDGAGARGRVTTSKTPSGAKARAHAAGTKRATAKKSGPEKAASRKASMKAP